MSTTIVQIGERFGKWTVIGPPRPLDARHRLCRCDCGTERLVRVRTIVLGRSTQCRRCSGNPYASDNARFWDRVQKTSGCWMWTGYRDRDGYGFLGVGSARDGTRRHARAHRLSYEMHIGPIPPGMLVCHTCDVAGCVRPDHLFVGTQGDNMADCAAKGRAAVGMRSGSRKIRDSDVREIRRLYSDGLMQRAIGERYGIHQRTVSAIVRRITWAHVA